MGVCLLSGGLAASEAVVRQTFPWLKEAPVHGGSERAMHSAGIALVQMADREYEPLCLQVENRTGETLAYRVDASDLLQSFKEKADNRVEVQVLSSWVTPIKYGNPKKPPLTTLGADTRFPPRDVGDPLMEVTPERILYCPAGENRSVWLILHTRGVAAGNYAGRVRLISADGAARPLAEVKTTVQVWPFALPEKLDIACYHWDYGCSESALITQREHKVNTFMIAALPGKLKVDAEGNVSGDMGLDRIAMKRKVVPWAKFVGSYGCFQQFYEWARERKIEYMSPEYKELLAKVLRYMVSELKKAGLDYDDFWIQHIDEANGEKARRVVEMGTLAREIDPNIRWYLTVMSSFKEIQDMAPYTQLIGKRGEAYWSAEKAEWYRQYQEAGNTIWQFKQMGMARGQPGVHKMNRLRQWRVWLNRWDGSATFVYNSCVYNWSGGRHKQPITVRHWEAIRESNEDYQYFAMARDLAARVGEEEKHRTVKLVDDLVQGLIGPTAPGTGMLYTPEHVTIMLYPYVVRARLAQSIASLRQRLGEIDHAGPEPLSYRPPWLLPLEKNADSGLLPGIPDRLKAAAPPAGWEPGGRQTRGPAVIGRTSGGGLMMRLTEGKWVADEYYVHAGDILEPGKKYRLRLEYRWDPELPGGAVLVEEAETWQIENPDDDEWHELSREFTAGGKDLNLRLKEFRRRRGREVAARTEWRDFRLVRLEPGGDLPGPPAPRLGFTPANSGGKDGPGALRLASPNTYAPVWWDSEAADLSAGAGYELSFTYRTRGTLQGAVSLVTEATRRDRKGKERPQATLASFSLVDTGGEWRFFRAPVYVQEGGRYRLRLRASGEQAPGPDGEPRPAVLEAGSPCLKLRDCEPLRKVASKVEKHFNRLRELSAEFPPDDPLKKLLAEAGDRLPGLLKEAKQTVADKTPPRAGLLDELVKARRELNSIPYATWLAGVFETPLPDAPPSSRVTFGTPHNPREGQGIPREKTAEDAAAIGIANLSDRPLCFMVTARPKAGKGGDKEMWGFCRGFGDRKGPPDRYRQEGFEDLYGWSELVVPPGKTRYLWVSEEGKVILESMDRRASGITFDVKLKMGLGF